MGVRVFGIYKLFSRYFAIIWLYLWWAVDLALHTIWLPNHGLFLYQQDEAWAGYWHGQDPACYK